MEKERLFSKAIKVLFKNGPDKFFEKSAVYIIRKYDIPVEKVDLFFSKTKIAFYRISRKVKSEGKRKDFFSFIKFSIKFSIGVISYPFISRYFFKNRKDLEDWVQTFYLTKKEIIAQSQEAEDLKYKPKISLITPTFNTPSKFLVDCIESVINQTYENWELCLADDASTDQNVRDIIQKYSKKDKRIRYIFRKKNGHISAASNSALKICSGEFVGLLDHDDVLLPNALFEMAKFINNFPKADFIYSDEDKITGDGRTHFEPFFKPDWSPDLLYSYMYTGHFTVYREDLVDKVGGFDSAVDYSQDYDLALKISENTSNIFHIPKILYSWRAHKKSEAAGGKSFARKSNLKALENAMRRRGLKGKIRDFPYANKFDYDIDPNKKVSIIIPSDDFQNSKKAIDSIRQKTKYKNFEIVLVINSKNGQEIKNEFKEYTSLKIVPFNKKFNFSEKCNLGAKKASGEFFVFLNDDMEILYGNWIEKLIEFFQREEVGAVSPLLLYETKRIQYAGMVTGVRGLVGTAFHMQPDSPAYFNYVGSTRNVSIVSGACMAIPSNVFNKIGGFDEKNTPIMHSDVDLSFRLRKAGFLLVYTPFTKLKHAGHKSLEKVTNYKKDKDFAAVYLIKNWLTYLQYDPFFPTNLRNYLYPNGIHNFEMIGDEENLTGNEISRRKRIIIVTHDLSFSGAPILLYELALELCKKNYSIVVVSPKGGELGDLYTKAGMTVIIDSLILETGDEMKPFFSDFDLIIANTILSWALVYIGRDIGVPVIWIIHESKVGASLTGTNRTMSHAFGLADKVIFAARSCKEIYQRSLRNNFEIIPYGINLIKGQKDNSERGKGSLVLLCMGSIEKRKGQDILVEAVRRLPNEISQKLKIYLIGRTLESKYYQSLKKNITNDNILLLDQVPYSEINKYYDKADILVCSSRDETIPLTILDAMQHKIAIISTKVGGIPEVIKDNKSGLLVPAEDPKALAKAIILLVSNDKLRNDLTRNAYLEFNKNYTIDRYVSKIEKVMKGLMKS